MLSYDGLYEQLHIKGITKTDLTVKIGISFRTIAKIAKGGRLSKNTLKRINETIEYKAGWNGRRYIKTDTIYASSQICSSCGYRNADTKDLSVREWMCPVCGTKYDRDMNAAKNILEEGLRQTA